jgi:hypothetical protein
MRLTEMQQPGKQIRNYIFNFFIILFYLKILSILFLEIKTMFFKKGGNMNIAISRKGGLLSLIGAVVVILIIAELFFRLF